MSGTAELSLRATALCALMTLPLSLAAAEARSATAVHPDLEVRLLNHLTSYSSPVGTHFRCVVIRGFHAGGLVIPRGSLVFGTVRKQQAVGLGFRHERAALELSFESYQTPAGDDLPLDANLASIDNAREEVTAKGRIKGVLAANNPGNLLNGFWARPSSNLAFRSLVGLTGAANQVWLKYSMGPMGAAGLFVARSIIVAFPEPEIHLPPGTDMSLRVRVPEADLSSQAMALETSAASGVLVSETSDGLSDWAKARLQPIFFANGAPAEDLLNVLVLGSREQVVAAFATSGWTLADHRSLRASSRVYGAFSSMRTYSAAPVSVLLYRGLEPDLVFEKSLDTVTQRHHVRFWRAGVFNGDEVWLGAATHDTGVTFRLRSMAFTHKIDRNIDLEREKVATDLDFSGCSEKPVLLHSSLRASSYELGRVSTDGRLVMLAAQPCSSAELTMEDVPLPPGNRLTRVTRRVVLETRNYLLRDNAYYWGYRVIRSSHNHSIPLLH